MLGEALMKKATNGKKQIVVVAVEDDLDYHFGNFSKSLRYGASLELKEVSLLIF